MNLNDQLVNNVYNLTSGLFEIIMSISTCLISFLYPSVGILSPDNGTIDLESSRQEKQIQQKKNMSAELIGPLSLEMNRIQNMQHYYQQIILQNGQIKIQ